MVNKDLVNDAFEMFVKSLDESNNYSFCFSIRGDEFDWEVPRTRINDLDGTRKGDLSQNEAADLLRKMAKKLEKGN